MFGTSDDFPSHCTVIVLSILEFGDRRETLIHKMVDPMMRAIPTIIGVCRVVVVMCVANYIIK